MNTELQRFEVQRGFPRDDDFAVEHRASRQLLADRIEQLGEISVERFLVAALDQYFVAVSKDQRAKTVPLRLKDPVSFRRKLSDSFCEHRQNGRINGKFQIL